MRRVSRPFADDVSVVKEQETEGQRQLHGLLRQQLHTEVDIDRCVAKKQCFASALLQRPFGKEAAGIKSLSEFQVLHEKEKELVRLRELGLTDGEIQLWQNEDALEQSQKTRRGVRVAPDAKQQRLQIIREKIEAKAELLSRPQRFATSRALSRREMEIEQSLYHGTERQGFLTSLYHQDNQEVQSGFCSLKDFLCTDVLNIQKGSSASHGEPAHTSSADQSMMDEKSPPLALQTCEGKEGEAGRPIDSRRLSEPLTVRGEIDQIPDEEILSNRESEEGIRSIARFRNYQPGRPSKVLCVKNMSAQASVVQLVALFSRFETGTGPPVRYRLLTGRMKGQAFITLPDTETAQNALQLVHGYRLLGKPLVIEFGHERREADKEKEEEKRDD